MTNALALLVVLLAGVLVLAACSRAQGPDVVLTATNSDLCQGIAQFRLATVVLTAGGDATPPAVLRSTLRIGIQRLQALAADPVIPDAIRRDLRSVSGGFSQIEKTLDASGVADAQAVVAALMSYSQDDKVTSAAARLDAVARHTCGLNTEGSVTSTSSTTLIPTTTTTEALTGPTATP